MSLILCEVVAANLERLYLAMSKALNNDHIACKIHQMHNALNEALLTMGSDPRFQ